jgi:tetratricopeptide (TPR) repeat protein
MPEHVEEEVRAGMKVNPSNRLDPLRVRGSTALVGGRYAEAAAMFEEARGLSEAPVTDWYLAQAYHYQGERERAEAMLAGLRGGAQAEQRARATLACFLAARGRRAQAESLLRVVLTSAYMDHHVAYAIGAAYTQLGERAPALKWLSRAVETGLPCYPLFEHDPLLDPLRGDPEFRRFMAELQKSWEAAKARYGA